MKGKIYRTILLLCLIFTGCTNTPTTSTNPPLSTASLPTPKPEWTAAPTLDNQTKAPEPLPVSMKLESGYILQLTGGLTEDGRARLEAGETGYFVLAYAGTTPVTPEGIEVKDMIERGVFFAIVEPEALASLQDLVSKGSLRYAGPLPPEAKLSLALAEEMKSATLDTQLKVTIRLIAPLTDMQRKELMRWLIIESESEGPIYLVSGSIENQHITNLLDMPVIRLVDKRVLLRP